MTSKSRSCIEKFEWLQRLPGTQKLTLVFVLSVTLVLLDFATGPFVSFPIAFAIPVSLAAWTLGKKIAVSLAITLPLIRFIYVWRMDFEQLPMVVNLANLVPAHQYSQQSECSFL